MFFVGLDLGQKVDPSALVAVEGIEHRRAFKPTAFQRLEVRYVERLPLGTPYPKVVERVREITWSQELRGNCALAVDATGVGAPVVDMLAAGGSELQDYGDHDDGSGAGVRSGRCRSGIY